MTTRLLLYNAALTICGEREIASLTEEREPRRLLDVVWDGEGTDACLERGQWKFAMRTVLIDYDPSVTPEFGLKRPFIKPDDWVVTSSFCSDEYFTSPILQYVDEAGYWYAELDQIYVRYVSNDANYGGDLSLWTPSFADYVAAHFAAKIIFKLTTDTNKREDVIKWEKRQLTTAKNVDAMAGPQQFPAPGNWVESRYRNYNKRDRGNRGSLIG